MVWNDRSTRRMVRTALAAAGMTVWLIIANVTGKDEPWDSELFWWYGLSVMLLLNAAASFVDPENIVVNGLISVSLQPFAMMFMAGEIGSMFPLGLFVFGLLGLLYSIGGVIGSFIQTKFFHNNN